MGERIGVMVCGHGSRSKSAVKEFATLAEALRPRFQDWPVEYGYLEFADPVIRDGLDKLRTQGADRILAVPGMLFAASHAKNDIPSVLNTYAAKHGIDVRYGRELGVDPKMIAAAGDRVRAAALELDERLGPAPASETCLVVVGRGASDPDANANVAKVARMLWEGFGFGWCEVAYSGVTFPLVEPCLETVSRLGFRRVIVFPYFLFSGILIDRIYGFTDEAAARTPDIHFAKAPYLGDHPAVIDTFQERITEILEGKAVMNCGLCKYRTQVLGFEAEVGAPQESHHHHVEGMGASAPGSAVESCDLCDTFCTGACRVLRSDHHHHDHAHGHDHGGGHHHHHYPHEKHPLGPVSVVANGDVAYERNPEAITAKSFEVIRAEADLTRFGPAAPVAERVAHAAGDTGILADLVIHGDLMSKARAALARNAPIVTDSEMTRHAISARWTAPERIVCRLNDPETPGEAEAAGTTRSAIAIRRAGSDIDGGIVVIGNAPTALFELLDLIRGGAEPAAILAFPVGFIGAAESKAALIALHPRAPFATLKGRRGGSAMAGAALNAIAGHAAPASA
ncbi:MAG: precorrin-8X methylmutase [Pseudomonadota bacterium]